MCLYVCFFVLSECVCMWVFFSCCLDVFICVRFFVLSECVCMWVFSCCLNVFVCVCLFVLSECVCMWGFSCCLNVFVCGVFSCVFFAYTVSQTRTRITYISMTGNILK